MTEPTVQVGGPYVEDEDFLPNPTDIHGTYITDGVGPTHDLRTISPIFEADKKAVAQQIVDSLDPESPVSESYISFPTGDVTREQATESIKALAEKTLEGGPVVINEPVGPEAEAAASGEEGVQLAQQEAVDNADQTGVPAGDGGASVTEGSADSTEATGETKPAE